MQPKARGHGVGSARESPAWAQIAAVVPEPREAEEVSTVEAERIEANAQGQGQTPRLKDTEGQMPLFRGQDDKPPRMLNLLLGKQAEKRNLIAK